MPAKRFDGVRPQIWMIHAGGAVLLAAALAAFYFGYMAPAAADMTDRTGRMEQLHRLMANSEAIARDHRELSERLAELRQESASTRQRIPRRPSTQEFIERITDMAESQGMHVELCTAAAPEVRPTHTQVAVTCRTTGSYAGAARFLAAVDQLTQISKVSRLEIDAATNSRVYPVHITFQLYYRGDSNDTDLKRGTP